MNILVTAGNTLVPIDQVRCITNIFTGRTGTQIALHCHEHDHAVTLLTSHPEIVNKILGASPAPKSHWSVCEYSTFEDLWDSLQKMLRLDRFDVLIHSAAVSDYETSGVYAPV